MVSLILINKGLMMIQNIINILRNQINLFKLDNF